MKKYPEKFKPLFLYKKEGLLRTEPFMIKYLELGFDENDIDLLTQLVFDEEINSLPFTDKNEGKIFAPIHAVMVLAKLKAKEPFYRLIEGLEIFGEDDDYFRNTVLYYLKEIGADFFDVLIWYFLDRKNGIYNRMLVFEALENIVEKQSDEKLDDVLEEAILEYLKRDDELNDGLNAFAIFALVDLSDDTHIELIREVFKTKPVDVWYDGDLEEIEMRLGLRTKRDTPKPRNIFDVPFGGFEDEILSPQIATPKIGRNDPCPCGSGKKYKKCCMDN